MIDRLLKATEEQKWSQASQLLSEHWITNALDCFNCNEKDPWETPFDEKKISKSI
jgi:hypothetical protein